MLIARLRSLWLGLRSRRSLEAEMSAEFRLHMELRAEDLVRSGLSLAAARRQARREFGSTERYKEEARAARGLRRTDELRFSWLDFKLGLRMLSRYPGLTIVGGLAMALAIGVGAAAFEAIKQVMRPTLPFPEGDRIVALHNWNRAAFEVEPSRPRDLAAWREQLRSVRDLGAFRTADVNLITADDVGSPIWGAEISASAFRITSAVPALGRVLLDADDAPGAPLAIVIAHEIWERRFKSDPAVIGQQVRLGHSTATIVGVMPADYAFPTRAAFWLPFRFSELDLAKDNTEIEVFGRLEPGRSLARAQAEVDLMRRLPGALSSAASQKMSGLVRPYAEAHTPLQCDSMSWASCMALLRTMLFSSNLFFVVFLMLVCSNVALLMFARAAAREGEIIVRNALGASRGRIITQLVTEALVLGLVAAVVGLALARYFLGLTVHVLEYLGSYPFWWQPKLSWPSVLYAVLLTLLGGIVAGALPALKVTRNAADRLRRVTAGAGGLQFGGVWTVVIVVQIVLTVVCAASAIYVTQQMALILKSDLGFAAREFLSAKLALADSIPASLYPRLEQRLRAEPAVSGVTFASLLPGHDHNGGEIEVEGVEKSVWVQSAAVAVNYFATLDVPISAGRGFHATEAASEVPPVIVNEAFVHNVLGGVSALGRRVRFRRWDPRTDSYSWSHWHEVVGVVQNVVMSVDPERKEAGLYVPLQPNRASVYAAVHVRGDAQAFAPRLRTIVTNLDPSLRLYELQPLESIKQTYTAFLSMFFWLVLAATAVVLSLSLAGIYAIMSFTVSQRTREIGIRVALGADRRRLLLSIFARPLSRFAAGVVTGVGLMVIVLGGTASLQQAGIVLAFTAVMMGVCLLACIVPTRRALRIEPTEALRAEG
jgi:putative ABC transport system permease protein